MALAHVLGFPRIGAQRELKFALESFWSGASSEDALRDTGRSLRARHWQAQADAGLDAVSVGDFAWYDQVLSTLALLGAVPERFGFDAGQLTLPQYFTLARGNAEHFAMEMTKWFDTNYHYLVPEWTADTRFDGGVDWLFDEIIEARAAGHRAKVTLVGPLTLLYLGKIKSGLTDKLDLLPRIVVGYQRVLARLKAIGIDWVQIDEPILALQPESDWIAAFGPTYAALQPVAPSLLLATYFDQVSEHAALLRDLPVAGVYLDLVRGVGQLDAFLPDWPAGKVLAAGIVDGRNIWRTDLEQALTVLAPAQAALGDRLWVASSCSLLHVPVDLAQESKLDDELQSWLAFATQKLDEIVAIQRGLGSQGRAAIEPQLAASSAAVAARKASPRIHNTVVQKKLAQLSAADTQRDSDFAQRIVKQQARFQLPAFPTTTIGSFPQTAAIQAREVIPDARLWVNPDCGLKTRGWPETCEALGNMVQAAQNLRVALKAEQESLLA